MFIYAGCVLYGVYLGQEYQLPNVKYKFDELHSEIKKTNIYSIIFDKKK